MLPKLIALVALLAASAAQALSPRTDLMPPQPRLMESRGAEKPVQLKTLNISSEISGGMAETTVRMVFFNPNSRQLEGELQFPLLPGQRISAFSLDINGQQRPAVPVEKAKGRQIFEAIERRKVDPGLLEVTQGNNFKLRVYPILAQNTRTVEITYTEALTRDGNNWSYRLPLAYGDKVDNFELALKVNGADAAPVSAGRFGNIDFSRGWRNYQAKISKSQFALDGAVDLQIPASAQAQTYMQEFNGVNYFLAEVPVQIKRNARTPSKVVGLLWDSSGSASGRNLDAELIELDRYFKAIGNGEVRLIRLRDRAEAAEHFKIINGNWASLRKALRSTIYDGASALADWQPQADVGEYLLVSDGLSNYGAARFPTLKNGQRLYALSSAMSADNSRLAALAERNGGRLAEVQADKPGAAADVLLSDALQIVDIDTDNASEVLVDSSRAEQGMLRIAGKLKGSSGKLTVSTDKTKNIVIDIPVKAPQHPFAAHIWAGYKLHELEADFEINRGAIRRLGKQFAMPTRETSLLVLERADDYVRYDVDPPAALQAEVDKMKHWRSADQQNQRSKHLDLIVNAFEQKVRWWEQSYPVGKDKPYWDEYSSGKRDQWVGIAEAPPADRFDDTRRDRRAERALMPAQAVAAPQAEVAAEAGFLAQKSSAGLERKIGSVQSGAPQIGISLKRWTPDAPYLSRLSDASPDTVYQVYLDEKPSYLNSTAFFLDAADILFDKGQRDLALRVLSNLAEMDLENRHVLRILGYRLMQAGMPELALPVFEKVRQLAEEEPQSFRDLGLAYAATKNHQQAINELNEVVTRPWDRRFAEIELVAVAEMNAIIAAAPGKLDTSRIDPRLLKNLPLDMRVVMNWDADNSDMDLWVTDPNGEKCYYGNRYTRSGARMSPDFTGGYGPEEFSLRHAKPGKYRIEANFFGSTQQIVTGATTLQVKVSTGFGTRQAKEQMVTLRLKGNGSTVFVGEFEVKRK